MLQFKNYLLYLFKAELFACLACSSSLPCLENADVANNRKIGKTIANQDIFVKWYFDLQYFISKNQSLYIQCRYLFCFLKNLAQHNFNS